MQIAESAIYNLHFSICILQFSAPLVLCSEFVTRILITSGPTRQFIDPVRYLTNASSGRMGKALAEAALALGHEVVVVSGPVEVEYPTAAAVVPVVSTEEMMIAAAKEFENCDG